MKKLTLSVTKAHISGGEQAHPGKCPIANSIIENLKKVTHVSVLPNETTIRVKKGKTIYSYKSNMPSSAKTFIKKFDDGNIVSPFKLTLNFKRISNNLVPAFEVH